MVGFYLILFLTDCEYITKMQIAILAAIDGQQLIQTVIWIVAIGLIFWLLTWLISYVGLPEPFAKIARIILAVAAVIFLINVILGLAGHPMINWK